jgi:hypothetical protein
MPRYTHAYIDYIRYCARELASKSYEDRKYIKPSLLCLDYFIEITRLTGDYTYDDLWNCSFADNKPFLDFCESHKPISELEQTVITMIRNTIC